MFHDLVNHEHYQNELEFHPSDEMDEEELIDVDLDTNEALKLEMDLYSKSTAIIYDDSNKEDLGAWFDFIPQSFLTVLGGTNRTRNIYKYNDTSKDKRNKVITEDRTLFWGLMGGSKYFNEKREAIEFRRLPFIPCKEKEDICNLAGTTRSGLKRKRDN
jgi:hypothetical protein